MRLLAPFAALLTLAACQSIGDTQKTWVGSTDTALLASWGAPDLESSVPGRGRVMTYHVRNGYGQIQCRANFVVNTDHRVIDASNNC